MPRHTGAVSKGLSDQLRRLERLLHIDRSGQSEWVWAIPAGGLVVWVGTLVVAGVMSGVWAAEFIPIALVEGLVIAGLFVACIAPEEVPPEQDEGNGGPDLEPPVDPPQPDPAVWSKVLAG